MTTNELIAILKRLDPGGDLEVIRRRYSDYGAMEDDDVEVADGIKKSSACYIMRIDPYRDLSHETGDIRQFVAFAGN